MYGFTVQDVVREVRRIAEEEPDFVYTIQPENATSGSCYYASADGQGNGRGCIVGQALGRLGVSMEALGDLDKGEEASVIRVLPDILPVYASDEGALNWLSDVQHQQDIGYQWGAAVRSADVTEEYLYGSN